MKYCRSCGAELVDEAVICPKCGVAVESAVQQRSQNKLGIAGFVLSLFWVQFLGFIFSLIGVIVGKKKNHKIGLAVAGLVISCIEILIIIIIYGIYGAALFAALSGQYSGLAMALPIL